MKKLTQQFAIVLGVIVMTGSAGSFFLEDYQKERILNEVKRLVSVTTKSG
ncbi:MAG: hypothetical protein AB3N28_10740 [Kordiimonas sp.]